MSSQIIPRAVDTQGPFMGLRESQSPPPAHLCHLPFLAPQPSLRRARWARQCLLHKWRVYGWVLAGRGKESRPCGPVACQVGSTAMNQEGSLFCPCPTRHFSSPSYIMLVTSQSTLKSQHGVPWLCTQWGLIKAEGEFRTEIG